MINSAYSRTSVGVKGQHVPMTSVMLECLPRGGMGSSSGGRALNGIDSFSSGAIACHRRMVMRFVAMGTLVENALAFFSSRRSPLLPLLGWRTPASVGVVIVESIGASNAC